MWNLCVSCLVVCLLGSTLGQTDIRKPPTITKRPPATFIYRSDNNVTLECKAEGIPAVTYEWKKNGFVLNQNLSKILKGNDGTITIESATSLDEGYYQCFASNQYGTALSGTTQIQRALLDSASGTPTPLQKTVQEGEPFHIQADPKKSFPKPTYGWEIATETVDKNPVPIRPSKRIQIAENGDLHFSYALPEDALDGKIYKCTTYNPYLDVKAGGSYTKLTVTRTATGVIPFAPRLEYSSETQTVAVIGGSVTLRCFFGGYPEPTISWSGPRNTLPIGRFLWDSYKTELTINNIIASDEGDYICTASNNNTSNTHTLRIRVEAVPSFLNVKDGPRDVSVTEGESFTFNCNPYAKPEATIVWLKDGNILDPNNPPKRFVFSGDKKSLTIRDVCRDCVDRESKTDLTVIQCNASNVHGYAFSSGYLNVLSKTIVTIHEEREVTVDKYEEGEVQFDCRATSDPSTPPTFQWYQVHPEGDQLLHNDPPFVTVNGGLLIIHVTANATEKWSTYLGQYRCVVNTGDNRVNQTANIVPTIVTLAVVKASMCGVLFGLEVCWVWVSIAAAVLGLFIILVFICCAICQRNKGDIYNIDKSERWTGKDPTKEYLDDGFEEYQRVPSFSSTTLLKITEEDSLNDYMGDEGKFTEDGSFIGDTYRSQGRINDGTYRSQGGINDGTYRSQCRIDDGTYRSQSRLQ